jgi:hypothetical protein
LGQHFHNQLLSCYLRSILGDTKLNFKEYYGIEVIEVGVFRLPSSSQTLSMICCPGLGRRALKRGNRRVVTAWTSANILPYMRVMVGLREGEAEMLMTSTKYQKA